MTTKLERRVERLERKLAERDAEVKRWLNAYVREVNKVKVLEERLEAKGGYKILYKPLRSHFRRKRGG